jgi:hypothetical protein
MLRSLLVPLLVTLPIVACASAAPPAPASAPPNEGAPEHAVRAYFRAGDEGSSAQLRAAFHPSAVMQWVDDGGALGTRTQLDWWLALEGAPPRPAQQRTLRVIDREGPLVLIEAISDWPTHRFDDLLLVVRTPDGWRIVGKVFERLAAGASVGAQPGDDAAIRAVLADKIAARAAFDPALLARSHTPACPYYEVGVGAPFAYGSLSEGAARYAVRRDRGETDHGSRWRVLAVEVRGRIAAAKLDVVVEGVRYVDHLLLVRLAGGWRIAAVAWGDPRA